MVRKSTTLILVDMGIFGGERLGYGASLYFCSGFFFLRNISSFCSYSGFVFPSWRSKLGESGVWVFEVSICGVSGYFFLFRLE